MFILERRRVIFIYSIIILKKIPQFSEFRSEKYFVTVFYDEEENFSDLYAGEKWYENVFWDLNKNIE